MAGDDVVFAPDPAEDTRRLEFIPADPQGATRLTLEEVQSYNEHSFLAPAAGVQRRGGGGHPVLPGRAARRGGARR